jgi:hypothetical protein
MEAVCSTLLLCYCSRHFSHILVIIRVGLISDYLVDLLFQPGMKVLLKVQHSYQWWCSALNSGAHPGDMQAYRVELAPDGYLYFTGTGAGASQYGFFYVFL